MERATAKKCTIHDLLTGAYVVKEGTTPNYVRTKRGEVSRANLIGVVVEKGEKSLVLDDGTGRMLVRNFGKPGLFQKIEVGAPLLVIGRPRAYQQERYVVAEIVKVLQSRRWLELRKAELERARESEEKSETEKTLAQQSAHHKEQVLDEKVTNSEGVQVEEQREDVVHSENKADRAIALIRRLDTGEGAPIERVLQESGDKEMEQVLTALMAEGEIFEIKPGRVKVLE